MNDKDKKSKETEWGITMRELYEKELSHNIENYKVEKKHGKSILREIQSKEDK